ncbi:E3 ubiquitin-protein ligase TRIM39-like [Polymixia lowei]
MASSTLFSEEQFQCPICLDVLTDPVTTSCGHNFCKACITKYWDNADHCQCPMCKNHFEKRPDLKVNAFISEMTSQFKKLATVEDAAKPLEKSPLAESGDVLCELCTEKKVKALKTCLVCLASFCETHLEPHEILASLKRHKLIDPVKNIEDRVCQEHERPLEMFCKNDKICVCQFCLLTDHKTHPVVPIEEECKERREELGKTTAQVEKMIEERQQKVQEIRNSVKVNEKNTEKEIAGAVQAFASLITAIKRTQAEIIETAQKRQKDLEKQAEEIIKHLEQEVDMLQTRVSELKLLSHTEDQFHLLKSSHSLCILPITKNMSGIKVQGDMNTETVSRALSQMEKTFTEELERIKLRTLRKQYAVNVTLDSDTAHPQLIISNYRKQVSCGKNNQVVLSNSKRFSGQIGVLSEEYFASGRFYYEVEVGRNTYWTVGVTKESIDRKRGISWYPKHGIWTIGVYGGVIKAHEDTDIPLSLKEMPKKLGVFVDYEEGEVSFYDVDTASKIYTFNGCTFTENLYPFFSVYDGASNPLIICPINTE